MTSVTIEKNTDKSSKITGDTRPIKETIKELGGSWNKGAMAWILPTSRKQKFIVSFCICFCSY